MQQCVFENNSFKKTLYSKKKNINGVKIIERPYILKFIFFIIIIYLKITNYFSRISLYNNFKKTVILKKYTEDCLNRIRRSYI